MTHRFLWSKPASTALTRYADGLPRAPLLLSDLAVTKTHSRPYVSNDNAFSEAQFKTMKYRPEFPERFGSIQDSRSFGHVFFPWYNTEHHHSGLGLLTPHEVHYGLAEKRVAARARVLAAALRRPSRALRHRAAPTPSTSSEMMAFYRASDDPPHRARRPDARDHADVVGRARVAARRGPTRPSCRVPAVGGVPPQGARVHALLGGV